MLTVVNQCLKSMHNLVLALGKSRCTVKHFFGEAGSCGILKDIENVILIMFS